jgi:DNA polymerase I-like protein with 3'-5' exonuclease and polymerase domains
VSYINCLIREQLRLYKAEDPSEYLALDTETTGLNLHHYDRPFFVSTCDVEGDIRHWEWPVQPHTRIPIIPSREKQQIKKYIANRILIFHNASFDLRALLSIDIDAYPNRFHDTQLAAHPFSSSDFKGLKSLSKKYLDYSDDDEKFLKDKVASACRKVKSKAFREELIATGYPDWKLGYDLKGDRATAADFWVPKALDPEDTSLATYGCSDAERTILLWMFYRSQFSKPDYRQAVRNYMREKLLLPIVCKKENRGITLKKKSITKASVYLTTKVKHHKNYAEVLGSKATKNKDFNVDSPDQNRVLLFDKFKLPILKSTEKGNSSTDKDTLKLLLKSDIPYKPRRYVKELLTLRAYQSALRYLKSYVRHMLPTDDPNYALLHSNINQTGTRTTRYATSSPNQQNISIISGVEIAGQTIELPSLRSIFSPPPRKVWYAIDYSQLELRIFAVLANDERLINAFARGEDIHHFVATEMFPRVKIDKELRRRAKAVSFGIIYGSAERSIDKAAGFKGAYKLFISKFPKLTVIKAKLIEYAYKHGFVETLFGYQLDIPMNRVATTVIDYICQGTAGDIIKNATIAIDRKGIVDWKHSAILLQVHDELIIEVDDDPKYNNTRFLRSIVKEMENSGRDIGVSTPVSIARITDNWANEKKFKLKPRKKRVLA